jgi:hypothetical protein
MCAARSIAPGKSAWKEGRVVENSTHSIIRKYGGFGRGKQSRQPVVPLWTDFPVDPCRSELTSDRRIHAQSDRRLLRRKALNVIARSHSK